LLRFLEEEMLEEEMLEKVKHGSSAGSIQLRRSLK
jgi:hypothetical protein